MEQWHREGAELLLAQLSSGPVTPAAFQAALLSVPATERDAWLDLAFGLEEVLGDGPRLPANCTPYLPCPVGTVLRALQHAQLGSGDVFVDIGSGVGRAALLAQLWTGATAVGIEIQPELAAASLALARRLNVARFSVLVGDAPELIERVSDATSFFLYCPFSGARLQRTVEALGSAARSRPIHVCCVQLPALEHPWLRPLPLPEGELAVYRSITR